MSLISLVDGIARNTNLSVDERALLHSLLLKLGVVSGWATTKGDITVTTIELTDPLAPQYGGTGIANAVGSTLSLAAALSVTGGGTIVLGGYTLTVPATGTAALGSGANKRVAVWSGTNAVGSSVNFQWDEATRTLTLDGNTLGVIQGVSDDTAQGLQIHGGNGAASGNGGGSVHIDTGDGNGAGSGGTLDITTGDGGLTGHGGNVSLVAGAGGSTSGKGGNVDIEAGSADGSGDGGDLTMNAGAGAGGADGDIILYDPTTWYGATLDVSSISADRTYTFPNNSGVFLLSESIVTFEGDILTHIGNVVYR